MPSLTARRATICSQADAFAVQNSDDPIFRTENRNILLNRRPYQNLLNEVAKRLK